jgi:hypothetical protein
MYNIPSNDSVQRKGVRLFDLLEVVSTKTKIGEGSRDVGGEGVGVSACRKDRKLNGVEWIRVECRC